MIEFKVVPAETTLGWTLVTHETEVLGHEARLAIQFIDKILLSDMAKELVKALEDEELQKRTVQEMATRACELAEFMMAEMRNRDWIIKGPSIKEAQKIVNETR